MGFETATRPSGFPGWASGVSGYVAEPTASQKALGWAAGQAPPASYQNWLHVLTYGWLKYLDVGQGVGFLGDGSDGSLTIVAPTLYQLSRHMMLDDLTVTGVSAGLDTNGYVPFVRGRFAGISGVIKCNGPAGGTGTSGSNLVGPGGLGNTGPLRGGMGAGTGLAGPTGTGQTSWNSLGGSGGAGALGGVVGCEGGAAVLPSGVWRLAPPAVNGLVHWHATGGATSAYLRGGGGGGAGGRAIDGAAHGGGGAGAGVVLIACQEVDFVGVFEAKGGNGGGGYDSGGFGDGGGGGGGGAVIVTYGRKTTLTARVDTSPGLGGTTIGGGSVAGLPGCTGMTGVVEIKLSR